MVDTYENTFEKYLLKSLVDDLDDNVSDTPSDPTINFDDLKKTRSSESTENSENGSDSEEIDLSNKSALFNALTSNKKILKLQEKISSKMTQKEISLILTQLKGNYSKVICGKYSNYFINDLIKKATKKHKIQILREIYLVIDKLAMHEYGTHPIQTLVEKASSKEEIVMIINSISNKNKFLTLAKNPSGTFVIQKIITNFHENYRKKINTLLIENLLNLSLDVHGVCVVKKFISNCEDQNMLYVIVSVFLSNFMQISENKYGNYAIQSLIDKLYFHKNLFGFLKQKIVSHFVELSTSSFGVHIVDSFLKKLTVEEKQSIFYYLTGNLLIQKMYLNKNGKTILYKLLDQQRFPENNLPQY